MIRTQPHAVEVVALLSAAPPELPELAAMQSAPRALPLAASDASSAAFAIVEEMTSIGRPAKKSHHRGIRQCAC